MTSSQNARQRLYELRAGDKTPPAEVKVADSYGDTLRITVGSGGDIGLQCVCSRRIASVTFAGPGGGDYRPLTREALCLLALALQEEGGQVK